MRITIPFALMILLLVACARDPEPNVAPDPTPEPTEPPPAGTVQYDGCAFTINYPPELFMDGSGWYALLATPTDPTMEINILTYRKSGAKGREILLDLAQEFPAYSGAMKPKPLEVIDHLGRLLTGSQGTFTSGDMSLRILVVVRPNTLLGNMLPDDVVYELVAQSSGDTWSQWEPSIDTVFQTFHPRDCGGV